MTPFERKRSAEEKLASIGIALIDNLPPLENENNLIFKTPQQIAKRILILSYLNCVAYDASLQQEVMMFLISEKLWDEASVKEKALFHNPKLTEDEAAEIQWRAESIWLMLWAINKVNKLELPEREVNPAQIFALIPEFLETTHDFIAAANTRVHTEIMDETDFTFRLNWAIREASDRDQIIPGINPFAAYQRYVSLNWIVGLNDQWPD